MLTLALLLLLQDAYGPNAAPPQGTTVDYPEYKSWSAFQAGASVTIATTSETDGKKSESESVLKLLEIDPKKAVVETTTGGKTSKREIPAKLEIKPGPQPAPRMQVKERKEGRETVEIDGRKLECRWVFERREEDYTTTEIKTWTSEKVPGGLVREESTVRHGGPVGGPGIKNPPPTTTVRVVTKASTE